LTQFFLLSQLNLYIMAFNLLLPAYPLDGGRILADLLLLCGVNARTTAIITVVLAVAIAGALIAWGIVEVAILTIAVCLAIPLPSSVKEKYCTA
jgi:Zn-dependent protease